MSDERAPDDDDERDEDVAEIDDPRLVAAWRGYRAGDAPAGEREARAFIGERPEHGEGWYVLACCLERQERLGEADRCFRRAAQARVCARPAPYRCAWRRFSQIVDEARDALKPDLRAALAEVSIVLADYAEPGLLDGVADAELLGLFVGPERGELAEDVETDVAHAEEAQPRIFLFRRAHEHSCREAEEFADELKRTLWHEFGHYLGYGEDGIAKLGLE